MTAGINYVLIKSNRTREELMSGIYKNRDGSLLISDITLNKPNQSGAHKCQHGTVLNVGHLWYDREDTRSMSWKTENEILPDDIAVYYYNDDAWNQGKYHIEGNDVYFFIKYENIYFVIRNEKIIPVNGYVLVEPIRNVDVYNKKHKTVGVDDKEIMGTDFLNPEPKLWLLDGGVSKTYGHVRHIGTPLQETRITKFSDGVPILRSVDGKPEFYCRHLKEGDFVFYPSWCAKPIMYSAQNFVGELYAQHRFGMWCVIEDVSRVTLKENTKHVPHQEIAEMDSNQIEQARREWSRMTSEKKAKTLYY